MWNPSTESWLNLLNKLEKPWKWLLLSSFSLLVDYFSGPLVHFPITFIFPVALAAWHRNLNWAVGIALSLPLFRGGLNLIWDFETHPLVAISNLLIRITVLLIFAFLIHKISMQSMELRKRVKILEGILPICSFCKKIPDKNNDWHQVENYITDRSEVRFSHSFCPECSRKHYPEFYKNEGEHT